jgi:tripartite-type tricarboxylate transporter receptor subunit TctC
VPNQLDDLTARLKFPGDIMMRRVRIEWLPVCLALAGAGAAPAQNFPLKPVRVITGEAGGATDIAARLMAQGLAGSFGQQVVVENRGGSIIIPAQMVAQAPPDGHTLLFYSSSIWLLQFMQDNVPFDPLRDFAPVTLAVSMPTVLVVHPSLPVKSVRDLINLARAQPGRLNYGSGASGGANHLSPELFKAMAQVNIVRIAYKGAATALNETISGELQVMFPAMASGLPHVKSGRLRALAVTSAEPTALAPGLPTIAASGLPGYESTLRLGLLAPAHTPPALVRRLSQETVRVFSGSEVKTRLFGAGAEVIGSTPEAFEAAIRADLPKWGRVIRNAGIRAE